MFFALLLFIIPFAFSQGLSWHPAFGRYRASPLNPMLLVSGFVLLVAGDYGSMWLTGSGELTDRHLSTTDTILVTQAVRYIAMLMAMLFGVTAGLIFVDRLGVPAARQRAASRPVDVRMFATVVYVALLILWLTLLLPYAKSGLSLGNTAEIKNASAWDSPLFTVTLLLVPGLSYVLPRQSLRVVIPLVVISVALLLFSGSRTRILYVLIPLAFYLVAVLKWRIPRSSFVVGALVLGFLALIAVNYRVISSNRETVTFSQVAATSNVFNINDVAFAETGLALSRLPRKAVEQYPGQSLVGVVFAAVPRSMAPFKPYKGSDQFTQTYDPINWRLFKRGLTIGAINEIQYDYPFPLALMLIFGFAALWAGGFATASHSRTIHGFVWSIGLYIALYSFLKSDIQSAAQIFWIFVLFSGLVRLYQRVAARPVRAPGPSNGRQVPATV